MSDLMIAEPWFGYVNNSNMGSFERFMNTLESDPECMIQLVTNALFDQINEDRRLGLSYVKDLPFVNVGQFVLSSGSCSSGIRVYGPFDGLESAMEYAENNLNVTSFFQ